MFIFFIFVMPILATSQQSHRIRFLTPNPPHSYNRRGCNDCHYADQYKVFTTGTLHRTRQTNASHTEWGADATGR